VDWTREYVSGTRKVATINDVTGPRGANVNRPVTHVVSSYTCSPVSFDREAVEGGSGPFGPIYFQRSVEGWTFPNPGYGEFPSGLFNRLSSVTKSGFFSNAIEDATKQIPTQFSLPNFLLEIDDIPKTLQSIRDLAAFGPKSVRALKSSFSDSAARRRIAGDFSQDLANFHLAYQFGVKPLIDDVASALGTVDAVQRRIAYLKRRNGKSTLFQRSKRFRLDPKPTAAFGGIHEGIGHRWVPITGTTELKVGMTIRPNLGGLSDASRELVAYSVATGFNKPLSILWEAIPYSFLLDYVSNIGDIVSKYDSYEAFDGSIDVINGWSSEKTQLEALLEIAVYPSSGGTYISTHPAGKMSVTEYVRNAGIPTNQGLVFDINLSGLQALNILALIRQAL
jgi:hypothetical protein